MFGLPEFFSRYGFIAGLYKNYSKYLNLLIESGIEIEEDGSDLRFGKIFFPKMTESGTFVLDGNERCFISQELKISTEMFVADHECRVNVNGSYHQLIVKFEYTDIYINLDSIRKDIVVASIGTEFIGIKIPDLFEYFEVSIVDVSELLSTLTDSSNQLITTLTCSGAPSPIDNETCEIIRKKIFDSCTKTQMLYTILIAIVKSLDEDYDRDSYKYKYIRTAPLMIYNTIKRQKDAKDLLKSLKTGKLVIRGNTYQKLASVISRRSNLDAVAMVRKIVTVTNENSSNMEMRNVHVTQKGFICPSETTDGKNAGLSKHIALTAIITGPFNISKFSYWMNERLSDVDGIHVVLNGLYIGRYDVTRYQIKSSFRYAGVYVERNIMYIRSVDGRLMRPVIHKSSHFVHMIDPAEQIHHFDEYSEIHPLSIVGLTASMIPYGEHNQSARVVFACNMIKQAIECRYPPNLYDEHRSLIQGQLPIVNTVMNDIIINAPTGSGPTEENIPFGVNVVIAIATYKGFNQEDSIVINRSAIDRGLFHTLYYKNTSVPVDSDHIIIPVNDPERDDRNIRTSRLGKDKSEITNTVEYIISGGTEKVMLNVRLPVRGTYKSLGSAINELKETTYHTERFRQYRRPEVGDKLASRHAQKSIIGLIVDQEDMPFTEEGIVPDLIINPHAIPSRMTVGQLIESLEGKVGSITGTFVDGTMFSENRYLDTIEKHDDTENMIDGCTGEYIENPITIGIVYYMVLKQNVRDKLFSRYDGPVSKFSRQPTAGKAKDGGLRIGEMETDALISHEAYGILENVIEQSDSVKVSICKTCKSRIHARCPRDHEVIVKNIPMSRVITEDLLASLCIGTDTF